HVLWVTPGKRAARAFRRRRHVGAHDAEHLRHRAVWDPGRDAEQAARLVTRASSAAAAWWSGANITPNVDVTASYDASSYGRCSQSATSKRISNCSLAVRLRALAINVSAESTPVTSRPRAAAGRASSPVPVATSSSCWPGRSSRRSSSASIADRCCSDTCSYGAELQAMLCRSFNAPNVICVPFIDLPRHEGLGPRVHGWTAAVKCETQTKRFEIRTDQRPGD